MKLFATKSVETLLKESEETGENCLRRALGPVNLLTLGVGAVIGAGIFVITGQAAAQFAGPAILISFVLAGIACAFAGLCYAEFASMIPIAGSAYTYSYATLGELVAWIIGWDLILEYAFGAATVAVGWSGNLRAFVQDLGFRMPNMPQSNFIVFGTPVRVTYDYISFVVILIITAILVVGIKESREFHLRDCLPQSRRGPGLRCAGDHVPDEAQLEAQLLASVPAAELGRARNLWMVGRAARGGRGLLRLYRF